jgi:hypothetical protein
MIVVMRPFRIIEVVRDTLPKVAKRIVDARGFHYLVILTHVVALDRQLTSLQLQVKDLRAKLTRDIH